MSRAQSVGFVLVVCVVGFGVFWTDVLEKDVENQPVQRLGDSSSFSISRGGETKGRLISKSIFLEEYGGADHSIQDDLESVFLLLNDCQLMFKKFDSFFLPDNQAITSFLSGENPDRLIWIPPSHLAVSQSGELLDRHGIPLFFHRVSGLKFEVYSAGKDREMWTEDDVVYPRDGGSRESD